MRLLCSHPGCTRFFVSDLGLAALRLAARSSGWGYSVIVDPETGAARGSDTCPDHPAEEQRRG